MIRFFTARWSIQTRTPLLLSFTYLIILFDDVTNTYMSHICFLKKYFSHNSDRKEPTYVFMLYVTGVCFIKGNMYALKYVRVYRMGFVWDEKKVRHDCFQYIKSCAKNRGVVTKININDWLNYDSWQLIHLRLKSNPKK